MTIDVNQDTGVHLQLPILSTEVAQCWGPQRKPPHPGASISSALENTNRGFSESRSQGQNHTSSHHGPARTVTSSDLESKVPALKQGNKQPLGGVQDTSPQNMPSWSVDLNWWCLRNSRCRKGSDGPVSTYKLPTKCPRSRAVLPHPAQPQTREMGRSWSQETGINAEKDLCSHTDSTSPCRPLGSWSWAQLPAGEQGRRVWVDEKRSWSKKAQRRRGGQSKTHRKRGGRRQRERGGRRQKEQGGRRQASLKARPSLLSLQHQESSWVPPCSVQAQHPAPLQG